MVHHTEVWLADMQRKGRDIAQSRPFMFCHTGFEPVTTGLSDRSSTFELVAVSRPNHQVPVIRLKNAA